MDHLIPRGNMRVLRSDAPVVWDGMLDYLGGFWSFDIKKEDIFDKFINLVVSVIAESSEKHEYIVRLFFVEEELTSYLGWDCFITSRSIHSNSVMVLAQIK